MKRFSILAALVILFFTAASAFAFTPAYRDYRGTFDPARWTGPDTTHHATMGIGNIPDEFRFYVAPGTLSISINLYSEQFDKSGAVALVGVEPRCRYSPDADYYNLPWDGNKTTPCTHPQLNAECQHRNYDGTNALFAHAFSRPSAFGYWVFVKVIRFGGSGPGHAQINTEISIAEYRQWYATAQWDGDGNPLPVRTGDGAGVICDPAWVTVGSVTPTPTVTATPTPDGGMDQLSCLFAGGKWVDGQCVLPGTPTPTATLTPTPTPEPPKAPVLTHDGSGGFSWTPTKGATGYLLAWAPMDQSNVMTVDVGLSLATALVSYGQKRPVYVAVVPYGAQGPMLLLVSNLIVFE